jgi:hypothetical protein
MEPHRPAGPDLAPAIDLDPVPPLERVAIALERVATAFEAACHQAAAQTTAAADMQTSVLGILQRLFGGGGGGF